MTFNHVFTILFEKTQKQKANTSAIVCMPCHANTHITHISYTSLMSRVQYFFFFASVFSIHWLWHLYLAYLVIVNKRKKSVHVPIHRDGMPLLRRLLLLLLPTMFKKKTNYLIIAWSAFFRQAINL